MNRPLPRRARSRTPWGAPMAARFTLLALGVYGALGVFGVLGAAPGSAAARFPNHPIRLIVPFGPGGPPDVAARIIAGYLSDHLGPVVVENHVGAGGGLALRQVATSPPDGYTLLAGTAGSLSISPQVYKDGAGVDPLKAFAAVAMVSAAPLVLAVNKSVPVHSVRELVAYAKDHPGKLNYGAVVGTPPHLSGEMFKHLTGARIVFVPYKSAAQATNDVVAGQMNLTFEGTTAISPLVKSGQLRALAVTSARRIPELSGVPTMDEVGYRGMPPDSWQAIVAPAGTPEEVVAKINAVVNEGLATKLLSERIRSLGGEPQPQSVAAFARYIVAQYERWGEVIRITGVKLNE